MAVFEASPTKLDRVLSDNLALITNGPLEKGAEGLTWAADEHVMLAAASVWWLICRRRSEAKRAFSNHLLASAIVSAALPHAIKKVIDEERPDRRERRKHGPQIATSGKQFDSFPSGHAVHIGAFASAASLLRPGQRNAVWAVAAVVAATRVATLAHWAGDVVAGLAVGAAIERMLRQLTQPVQHRRQDGEKMALGGSCDQQVTLPWPS
jgi:undecaprenyl-diphosphatase